MHKLLQMRFWHVEILINPVLRTFLRAPELKKRIGSGKNKCCNKPATGLHLSAIGLFLSVIGLQQADCRQKQADCRQMQANCR